MSESWQETEDTLRMSTWWEVLKKEIIYKSVGKAYGTKDRMPGTLGQEHQGDGGTSAGTQRKIRGAGPCRSCGLGGGDLLTSVARLHPAPSLCSCWCVCRAKAPRSQRAGARVRPPPCLRHGDECRLGGEPGLGGRGHSHSWKRSVRLAVLQ